MGRTRPALRDLLAMLCIGIALLFAGASAASVVDGVQHAAKAPHEHHFSLTSVSDDHHDHGQDSHHQQGDDDAGDHQTGPGHHHSGPPAVALTGLEAPTYLAPVAMQVASANSASKVEGLQPGGLDRPPRSPAMDA